MEIIKNMALASELDKRLVEDLESFFPDWLKSILPFYELAKRDGDFAFNLLNNCGDIPYFTEMGMDFYRQKNNYNGQGTVLSFYGGNRYHDFDWKEAFDKRFHYQPSFNDKVHLHPYTYRLCNKRKPYNELNNRLSAIFKELTGNDKVEISLGWLGTYIILEPDIFWKYEEWQEKMCQRF